MNQMVSDSVDSWDFSSASILMILAATEILDIVHQSLRRKVASLDDDNWMFEPENDTRF